jgi:hypothetical protein
MYTGIFFGYHDFHCGKFCAFIAHASKDDIVSLILCRSWISIKIWNFLLKIGRNK